MVKKSIFLKLNKVINYLTTLYKQTVRSCKEPLLEDTLSLKILPTGGTLRYAAKSNELN